MRLRSNTAVQLPSPQIVSPLSPVDAIARLEDYARDWHESRIPDALRKRSVCGLVLKRSGAGFRIRLIRSTRGGVQCVGKIAANGTGSTITYEIAFDRPTIISLCCVGITWLVMLLWARFTLAETLGFAAIAGLFLLAMAAMQLAYLRGIMASGVDEMLRGLLQCEHLNAET